MNVEELICLLSILSKAIIVDLVSYKDLGIFLCCRGPHVGVVVSGCSSAGETNNFRY